MGRHVSYVMYWRRNGTMLKKNAVIYVESWGNTIPTILFGSNKHYSLRLFANVGITLRLPFIANESDKKAPTILHKDSHEIINEHKFCMPFSSELTLLWNWYRQKLKKKYSHSNGIPQSTASHIRCSSRYSLLQCDLSHLMSKCIRTANTCRDKQHWSESVHSAPEERSIDHSERCLFSLLNSRMYILRYLRTMRSESLILW